MLHHCVFYCFLFFDCEKEKDEHDIFDTAKTIENCYLAVLSRLIYQILLIDS